MDPLVISDASSHETGAPGASAFVYLSALLDRPVDDALGARLGRVADLTVAATEAFPLVHRLVIRQPWPSRVVLIGRWADVATFRDGPVRLGVDAAQLVPALPDGVQEVHLRRDVLDKQVVDTSGLKIVRVNDVQFLAAGVELRAVHVDVGFRGLVRRLGVEGLIDGMVRRLRPRAGYLAADNLVSWRFVETLSPGAPTQHLQLSLSRAQVDQVHPVAIAELLAALDPARRLRLLRALEPDTVAEAFGELPLDVQARSLEMLPRGEAAALLGRMPADEAADLLATLPEGNRSAWLAAMSHVEAAEVAGLMEHAPDTAGGLMTTEFVALPATLTVGEALERMRSLAPAADVVYYVYVVNEAGSLVGVVSLRSLIVEDPATPIADLMLRRPVAVEAHDGLEECATLVAKYNLLAVPVVRPDRTLLGVITVDDVLGEVLAQAWRRKFTR